jgi:outer membrane protease
MASNGPADTAFREGEEVVLAKGSYQGTLGVFVGLKEDFNWANNSNSVDWTGRLKHSGTFLRSL